MTTKLHLLITADCHVIEGFLTGGNIHDVTVAEELTAEVVGCYILADRGYDSDRYRTELESLGNTPVIPGRRNRKVEIKYDKTKYRVRGAVERFFGKIKENRRLAARYEKDDLCFLSFIACAAIKMYLC